jgi:soluble lytic murein transglycosylase-like protein
MDSRNLTSINNYFSNNASGRIGGGRRILQNRSPFAKGSGFKKILSSMRAQPSKNVFKTRGLTIADYRARPVISKSSYRSKSNLRSAEMKNTEMNRTVDQRPSSAIKKSALNTHSLQKTQAHGRVKILKAEPDLQKVSLTEVQIIEQTVQAAAAKYNLSPDLIKGVIRAESNFKVRAVSSAGAMGLMQLMPATAKALGVNNPFDIEQNINGGAKYLRKMLDRFGGNLRNALAAYNAGPGTVIKYNGRVPYPETRQYVKRVLRFSKQTA